MPSNYIYDHTGLLPSNKITNELHTPTSSNAINPYLIIPDAAPYFGDSLTIINNAGSLLVEGVDYYKTHDWEQARLITGKAIYGTITFVGSGALNGVSLIYQTLGGDYVINRPSAITEGIVSLDTALTVDWDTIPTSFPVNHHTEEINSIHGMTEVLASIEDIRVALQQPLHSIMTSDIEDLQPVIIDPVLNELTAIRLAIISRNTQSNVDDVTYNARMTALTDKVLEANVAIVNLNNLISQANQLTQ